MARTISADNVLVELRHRSDTEGLTDRHPDVRLLSLFNRSWQSLRELVSEAGGKHFLKPSTGTLPTAESVNGPFAVLDMPTDALRVYGITVDLGSYWLPLEQRPFGEHTSDQPSGLVAQRAPMAYFAYQHAQESGTTTTTGKLGIWPVPATAYPYVLWYLPQWTDISGTSVLSEVSSDWLDWALWDSVIKIAARDDDMRNTYGIAVQERERLTKIIRENSARMDRGQSLVRRQDRRGRRDWENARLTDPPWR